MCSFARASRLRSLLVIASLLPVCPLWAQETDPDALTGAAAPVSDTSAEERIGRIREEMTAGLARAEALERELSEKEQELEQLQAALATTREDGDPQEIKAAEKAVYVTEEWIDSLKSDITEERELYNQTVERFQIAQQQADLASSESAQPTTQEAPGSAVLDTLRRRGQVTQAEQEALLAEQRVDALRTEIGITERRQKRLQSETDQINLLLDEGRQLERQQRIELTQERQRLIDEERRLDDRLNDLRGRLVLAETTFRIKAVAAQRELTEYKDWRRQLVRSFGLLLGVVAILLLLRILVSRYVDDPDRLYAANRALSIAMTFVLFVGLGVIFFRQFPNLFTGIGVVLAGVAIALQEVILSFFGFFAIRGARGYRTSDWIRIGEHYGEVVDIGLLVTILEEVTPIDFMSHRGGTKTGALIWVNNNAIFREKMTNYTRGFPYIWCTLSYTFTFESDWQRAVELLRAIVDNHQEITTTAKLARKKAAEAASNFAIKVDNTGPRVHTWTADSGVEVRLRFMAHPRRRRALIDVVNRQVMQAVTATEGVKFAYTTMRVIPTPEATEPS